MSKPTIWTGAATDSSVLSELDDTFSAGKPGLDADRLNRLRNRVKRNLAPFLPRREFESRPRMLTVDNPVFTREARDRHPTGSLANGMDNESGKKSSKETAISIAIDGASNLNISNEERNVLRMVLDRDRTCRPSHAGLGHLLSLGPEQTEVLIKFLKRV